MALNDIQSHFFSNNLSQKYWHSDKELYLDLKVNNYFNPLVELKDIAYTAFNPNYSRNQ